MLSGNTADTEVISGRTDPFVQGVLSVDSNAKNLGCQDASKGADAAKQIVTDLVTQHSEVNLIYCEASNLTVGALAALRQAGRGKFNNGKPSRHFRGRGKPRGNN